MKLKLLMIVILASVIPTVGQKMSTSPPPITIRQQILNVMAARKERMSDYARIADNKSEIDAELRGIEADIKALTREIELLFMNAATLGEVPFDLLPDDTVLLLKIITVQNQEIIKSCGRPVRRSRP